VLASAEPAGRCSGPVPLTDVVRAAGSEVEQLTRVELRSGEEVRLDLPLGVTRVLVGDMADEGLVSVHRPVSSAAQPDRALLQRVLAGLRAI
jgi:hypothetical protein